MDSHLPAEFQAARVLAAPVVDSRGLSPPKAVREVP
jgi:hypothetical protein